jgi:hypothetical protein
MIIQKTNPFQGQTDEVRESVSKALCTDARREIVVPFNDNCFCQSLSMINDIHK